MLGESKTTMKRRVGREDFDNDDNEYEWQDG